MNGLPDIKAWPVSLSWQLVVKAWRGAHSMYFFNPLQSISCSYYPNRCLNGLIFSQ